MDREKQAWVELERSSMSNGAKWVLAISFLLFTGFVFLADLWKPYGPRDAIRTFLIRDRVIPDEPPGPFGAVTDWNDEAIADIGRFEDQIEEESVLRATVPFWQWFQARVLDSSGTARVFFGRDGWLFLRENVEMATGRVDEASLAAADEAIRELASILAERGAELVLVPIPPKPEMEPDRFSSRFRPGDTVPVDPVRRDFYAGLEDLPNVSVLSVREWMVEQAGRGVPSFLERDTHWTPEAMGHVASMIAATVAEEGQTADPENVRVAGQGDLVRMLEMGERAPFADQVVQVQRWPESRGATQEADLVLLGDSFSVVFSDPVLGWGSDAGLVDQLRGGHGLTVKSFVNHGDPVRAPRQSLKRYLEEGGALPKVVVWQFAERFLNEGGWDWRMGE